MNQIITRNSKSFKFKPNITGRTPGDGNTKTMK